MAETKSQILSVTLPYMGRLFKKKGTSDKGKEWSLFQLNFNKGGQYPWKCTAFVPLGPKSINFDDMKEGEEYTVLYVEEAYTHEEYGEQKSKRVVSIQLPQHKDQTTLPATTPTSQPVPSTPSVHSPKDWEKFSEAYNGSSMENKNAMHMLGAYVFNNHAEEFKEVIENCKKNFK